MNNYLIFAVLFLLLLFNRRRKQKSAAIIKQHLKHKKEYVKMKELAQRFIGKECLVYTVANDGSAVSGTITEVTDSGILIEYDGNLQAVNIEYVTRIREWPRNAKGKKKTFFA